MISIILFSSFLLSVYDNLSNKVKEIINYIIIGFLTTIVSVVSYFILRLLINNYIICTILSWIISVIFAYITNRIFVFHSNNTNITKEFLTFISARIITLLMELLFMFVFVNLLSVSDRISKIIVQFVILVSNYIFSKLFVFKRKDY